MLAGDLESSLHLSVISFTIATTLTIVALKIIRRVGPINSVITVIAAATIFVILTAVAKTTELNFRTEYQLLQFQVLYLLNW